MVFCSVQLQKFYKFGTTEDAMSGEDSQPENAGWQLNVT